MQKSGGGGGGGEGVREERSAIRTGPSGRQCGQKQEDWGMTEMFVFKVHDRRQGRDVY